ncbi:MAG: hypothetical protein RL068_489 [Actinomycetota bacterium]
MIRALQSRWSLDARTIALASLPSVFIVPASESSGDLSAFWSLCLANLISLVVAMLVIQVFSSTKWVRRHWGLVVLAGGIAGAIKGVVLWLAVDWLKYSQPELGSRITISTLSWILFVVIMAVIQYSLGEIRSSQQEVKQLLAQAKQEFDSLEAQRQWLIEAKVKGLETKLAKNFVQLLESLNNLGKGPEAYRDIAKALRIAARGNVRNESSSAWPIKSPNLSELFVRALATKPNALILLLAYLITSGVNTFRLSGFSQILVVVLLSGLALWFAVKLIPGKYSHLGAPLLVFIADTTTQLLVIGPINFQWSLAAAGWSLTLILTGSAFELARLRIEEDKVAATEALNTTQADIEWLSIQLEATNIDLAKYLHSILQTRLMSHALLLEQKPQNSQESVNELIEILSKPMSDFGQAVESIDKGLANLAREWQALIEVDLELVDLRSNDLASPTLLLVREAISNAVHHGLADKVWVRIKDQDSKRTIEVRDNGIGPTQNPAGMGTQTYESLSSNWSLTQASDVGSKLALELELR